MIARVAECCFWLTRYLERMAYTAQVLEVNRAYLLDSPNLPHFARWQPIVTVLGENERYQERAAHLKMSEEDERVQWYFTFSPQTPASIINTLKAARENARVVREVLSLEMWEAINALWWWMQEGQGKKQYQKNRHNFFRYLMDQAQLFQGLLHTTIRHDEPFTFLKLGFFLERASQTGRILDMNYHATTPYYCTYDLTHIDARSQMILRCMQASVAFFKQSGVNLSIAAIDDFLLHDAFFPQAVTYCLTQAKQLLLVMQRSHRTRQAQHVLKAIEMTLSDLNAQHTSEQNQEERHEKLSRLVDNVAVICITLQQELFTFAHHQSEKINLQSEH